MVKQNKPGKQPNRSGNLRGKVSNRLEHYKLSTIRAEAERDAKRDYENWVKNGVRRERPEGLVNRTTKFILVGVTLVLLLGLVSVITQLMG